MALTDEQRARINAKAQSKRNEQITPQDAHASVGSKNDMPNRKTMVGIVVILSVLCVIYFVSHYGGKLLGGRSNIPENGVVNEIDESTSTSYEEAEIDMESETNSKESETVELRNCVVGDTVNVEGREFTLVEAYKMSPHDKTVKNDEWSDYIFVFKGVNNTSEDWYTDYNDFNFDYGYNTPSTSPHSIQGGNVDGYPCWAHVTVSPGKTITAYVHLQLLNDFEKIEITPRKIVRGVKDGWDIVNGDGVYTVYKEDLKLKHGYELKKNP